MILLVDNRFEIDEMWFDDTDLEPELSSSERTSKNNEEGRLSKCVNHDRTTANQVSFYFKSSKSRKIRVILY